MRRPQWEGAFEGYAVNQAKQHAWRVEHLGYEREDLVQEAALVFCKCLDVYYDVEEVEVDNEAWFMSLFQTALSRRLHSLATKDTQDEHVEYVDEPTLDLQVVEWNAGYLEVLANQAPSEVRALLSLMVDAPSHLAASAQQAAQRAWNSRGPNATRSAAFVRQMLGYGSGVDVFAITKRFFR